MDNAKEIPQETTEQIAKPDLKPGHQASKTSLSRSKRTKAAPATSQTVKTDIQEAPETEQQAKILENLNSNETRPAKPVKRAQKPVANKKENSTKPLLNTTWPRVNTTTTTTIATQMSPSKKFKLKPKPSPLKQLNTNSAKSVPRTKSFGTCASNFSCAAGNKADTSVYDDLDLDYKDDLNSSSNSLVNSNTVTPKAKTNSSSSKRKLSSMMSFSNAAANANSNSKSVNNSSFFHSPARKRTRI